MKEYNRPAGRTEAQSPETTDSEQCGVAVSPEPPAATTFIIVRHGQTVWNSQNRWQGWLDSPLTDLGREQARLAAISLRDIPIDVAYTSDSGRAVETAEILLAGRPAVPLVAARELRERSYGAYEGLNTAEIDARFPGTRFDPDRDTREEWRAPGEDAETLEEVRARVAPFLTKLARRHAGKSVLLVTHSNVVRILDGLCCEQPLEEIWHRIPQNACIFVVQANLQGELAVVQHFHEE